MRRKPDPKASILVRYGGAALTAAGCGLFSDAFYRVTGIEHLTSVFLAGVLLVAYVLGSGPAYFATVLGFLIDFWLFDPRYTFAFGSPEDFDTLMIFLVAAGLISFLMGRVRDEAAAARQRSDARGLLLEATREFAVATEERLIAEGLAQRLCAVVGAPALVRRGEEIHVAPGLHLDPGLTAASLDLERAAAAGALETFSRGAWRCRALLAGHERLGIAAWQGATAGAESGALVDLLVDTAAAAIARASLAAAKSEAEARARTEDLRNALLSSISHDVRTPLAAILASASSLVEFGRDFDEPTRRDLAVTIEEEAVRLDAFVSNLLNMTRVEAGALTLEAAPFSLGEAVERLVDRRRRAEAQVTVSAAPDMPDALGDARLFEQALGNVVDNALRYGRGRPVEIATSRGGGCVTVEVRDRGPGVPEAELERIFEKFHRGAASANLSGTGLGLSITRGVVEAMGGSVRARNRNDCVGLLVAITLPAAA